jgi:predicted ferric reductase
VIALVAVAAVAVPLVIATTDVHFTTASTALAISIVASALAVSALVLQPLLATRRIRRHQLAGGIALALVLAHVGALFAESSEDAWFAMSPDGPTRARMALIATIALLVTVGLGVFRRRLPLSTGTWRILHAYLAMVVIVLGLGHGLLTDGALDGAGTAVLIALGAIGLLAIPAAHLARSRAARPRGRARARSGA